MPDTAPSSTTLTAPATAVIDPKQLGRMMTRMRLREEVVELGQHAELAPLGVNLTPENMRSIWGIGLNGTPEKIKTFSRCRQLYETNDWVGWLVDSLILFCNDGFSIGEDPELETWRRQVHYKFAKLARDIFLERILCNNAVLFWRQPDPQTLPVVTVMDCENVTLLNAFGKDLIKIKMQKTVQLTAAEKEELGERYAKVMAGEEIVVRNGEEGEFYRYITEEKNGRGLRLPKLYQVFQDLSVRDLLKMGDWNAAWLLRNIIRLVRRGHEIKSGALAGQDIHFLRSKEAKKIKTGLATHSGQFDMVTNFDVSITYSYMDAKYLDPAKYNGTETRLRAWAGPVGRLLDPSRQQIDPDTMKLLEVQVCALRAEVGPLLNELFSDAEFLGGVQPPKPIQVTWSANTFTNLKLIMERVRLAQSVAISSTRTAREDLGYDHARESARVKAEHADAEAVTPAFEGKQGMAGKGGRPPKNEPSPAP